MSSHDSVRQQRLVFGEVADLYDRVRPSYPPQLVHDVLEFAGLDSSTQALEVGSGSGKATVLFAARGIPILCLEPCSEMAAVARRNAERFPDVRIVESSFEDWRAEVGGFGLIFSAQAWHWITPEVRYIKAHTALTRRGTLALFWNWPT